MQEKSKDHLWTLSVIVLSLLSIVFLTLYLILRVDREPVRVFYEGGVGSGQSNLDQVAGVGAAGSIVASKNGTKYHLPTCPGAKQIAEKNKIIFASIDEARSAGYTPAANCKGLK